MFQSRWEEVLSPWWSLVGLRSCPWIPATLASITASPPTPRARSTPWPALASTRTSCDQLIWKKFLSYLLQRWKNVWACVSFNKLLLKYTIGSQVWVCTQLESFLEDAKFFGRARNWNFQEASFAFSFKIRTLPRSTFRTWQTFGAFGISQKSK